MTMTMRMRAPPTKMSELVVVVQSYAKSSK
jgi:hypothetical protein